MATFSFISLNQAAAADFTATINWGDNSPVATGLIQANPDGSFTVRGDHVYTEVGSYPIHITIQHSGGAEAETDGTASVSRVLLQPNPGDPTRMTLLIGGSLEADIITVRPADRAGNLQILLSNVLQAGLFKPTDSIQVFGQSGNDTVKLVSRTIGSRVVKIGVPAVLDGGDGNDLVSAAGSKANNIILGGDGNDSLTAGSGRDLLIGGRGADLLRAAGGEDVVIGDRTAFDANLDALFALMNQWQRTDQPYPMRVERLKGDVPGGLNDPYFLRPATVLDDSAVDRLYGQGNKDWFFRRFNGPVRDQVKDKLAGELITVL